MEKLMKIEMNKMVHPHHSILKFIGFQTFNQQCLHQFPVL